MGGALPALNWSARELKVDVVPDEVPCVSLYRWIHFWTRGGSGGGVGRIDIVAVAVGCWSCGRAVNVAVAVGVLARHPVVPATQLDVVEFCAAARAANPSSNTLRSIPAKVCSFRV